MESSAPDKGSHGTEPKVSEEKYINSEEEWRDLKWNDGNLFAHVHKME